jgi:hypothetical protein
VTILTGFDLCRAAMGVTGISAPEQSVLNVLAIMANDVAQCWPGINGPAGLVGKTKLSERAVQNAVKALAAAGHLTRTERPGKGVIYTVHPRTTCTPAQDAPVQEVRPAGDAPTPAPPAPKLPRTTISTMLDAQASRKPAGPSSFPCPDGVDPEHWADILVNRKSKRLANTPTAHKAILRELEKLSDEEWPPGRIVQHAAERGWGAIFDPRPQNGNRNGKRPDHQRSRGNGFLDAVIDAERDDRARQSV